MWSFSADGGEQRRLGRPAELRKRVAVIAANENYRPIRNWRLQTINANEARSEMGLIVASDPPEAAAIQGEIYGPYCVYAKTLPASYSWRDSPMENLPAGVSTYRLSVEESCLWEPVHPFLYKGYWERGASGQVPVQFGWRVLSHRSGFLSLNGRPFRIQGVRLADADEPALRAMHQCNCNVLLLGDGEWSPLTDRFGPFVLATLPETIVEASHSVLEAGPRKPSIGAWIVPESFSPDHVRKVQEWDKTTLTARWCDAEDVPHDDAVDFLLIRHDRRSLTQSSPPSIPWVAVVESDLFNDGFDGEAWASTADELNETLNESAVCVGWIVGGVS